MALRLIADASAQTTIALALTSGATSFVGASTANFTNPAGVSANALGRLTILDAGNPAFNPAAPLATPFEYCDYTTNTVGTNTISGITRGVAGTSAHAFFAGAIVAQGLLAEDILASVPWVFDEQIVSAAASIRIPASGSIPASYLGINWRNIVVKIEGRGDTAAFFTDILFRLNGDSGNNYYEQVDVVDGTSGSTSQFLGVTGSAHAGLIAAASAAAGADGMAKLEFYDAFNGSFSHVKHFQCSGGYTEPTGSRWRRSNGMWNSTAAIASITLLPNAGNFLNAIATAVLEP